MKNRGNCTKKKECKHKWKLFGLGNFTSPQPTMIVAVCEKCLAKRNI